MSVLTPLALLLGAVLIPSLILLYVLSQRQTLESYTSD